MWKADKFVKELSIHSYRSCGHVVYIQLRLLPNTPRSIKQCLQKDIKLQKGQSYTFRDFIPNIDPNEDKHIFDINNEFQIISNPSSQFVHILTYKDVNVTHNNMWKMDNYIFNITKPAMTMYYIESMYGKKIREKHFLTSQPFTIGRNIPDGTNGINVEQVEEEECVYPHISRLQHVHIFTDDHSWYIQYVGRNESGAFIIRGDKVVNIQKQEELELEPGDVIQLGRSDPKYQIMYAFKQAKSEALSAAYSIHVMNRSRAEQEESARKRARQAEEDMYKLAR